MYILSNEIQSIDKSSIPEKFACIFDKQESYRDKTRNGTHGKTAQFWFAYVEMVQLYYQFTRSITMGYLDLCIHSLYNISSLFLTFNHDKFTRRLVVYHNNLLKLQNTHSQLYEVFRNGCFAIKRTSKQFSHVPVDLTLEQSINADAACQRARISALTNSISARQRWAQSHSIIATVISKVFEKMGLTRKEDVTEELKSHRMNKNCQDLEKLINGIAETMNPFSGLIDKNYLFNIVTGKATQKKTATFLLDIMETGRKTRDQVIEDSVKDSGRFSRSIKRQKIENYATQAGRFKVTRVSDKKLVTVTRDLIGSILFHILQAKVDMGEVLRYLLILVPLSLCHHDGTMQNTPKSKLLVALENRINS